MNEAWQKGAESVQYWLDRYTEPDEDTLFEKKQDPSPKTKQVSHDDPLDWDYINTWETDVEQQFEQKLDLPLKWGNRDAAAFHRFKGFASAIIKDAELSDAIKDSLSGALAQGKSLRDWRKNANEIFDKAGLTRLNNWQAQTIYRTETTMAFGAGQYAKLQDVKKRFPYWQYVTAGDERVRDSHKALDGKIFKTQDAQYYPPVGFNCRCKARPISKRQAKQRGITGPDTVTPEMRANLQNAEFIGDKVVNFRDWLQVKMGDLPQASQQLIIQQLDDLTEHAPEQTRNMPSEPIDPDRFVEVTPAKADTDYVQSFLEEFGTSVGHNTQHIDKTGATLTISDAFFVDRAAGAYKIGRGRARYVKLFADTLKEPDEIWEITRKSGRVKRHYVKAVTNKKGERRYILMVCDKKENRWQGTTAFYSKAEGYIEKQREGERIYKKKRPG